MVPQALTDAVEEYNALLEEFNARFTQEPGLRESVRPIHLKAYTWLALAELDPNAVTQAIRVAIGELTALKTREEPTLWGK